MMLSHLAFAEICLREASFSLGIVFQTKHSRALRYYYTPGFFRSVVLFIYFTVNMYAAFWSAAGTR